MYSLSVLWLKLAGLEGSIGALRGVEGKQVAGDPNYNLHSFQGEVITGEGEPCVTA